MKGWYFSTASDCEQKRVADTQLPRKRAMTDSHAVKKEVKSHMPPGRNVCAFKDLKRAMHVSLYQQNLQCKRRKV